MAAFTVKMDASFERMFLTTENGSLVIRDFDGINQGSYTSYLLLNRTSFKILDSTTRCRFVF